VLLVVDWEQVGIPGLVKNAQWERIRGCSLDHGHRWVGNLDSCCSCSSCSCRYVQIEKTRVVDAALGEVGSRLAAWTLVVCCSLRLRCQRHRRPTLGRAGDPKAADRRSTLAVVLGRANALAM
jgi:hypothetical protein